MKTSEEKFLQRIAVKKSGRIKFLDADKIVQICSQGNYIEIHSGNEKFLLRETMNGIESKLNPKEFVRISRSAIVHLEKIKELRPLLGGKFEVVLKNGSIISSSRRYRKNLDILLKK